MEQKLIKAMKRMFLYCVGLLLITSCETSYEPDTQKYPIEYVVEGFVEWSAESPPTFVFLTKTLPFYDRVDQQVLAESFVRDASVIVTTSDGVSVNLTEVCLNEIDPAIADQIRERLVINGLFSDFCIYLDVLNELVEAPGTSYNLDILVGEDRLSAKTTIPDTVPVNRLFHEVPAGNVDTAFYEFGIEISDPVDQVDYYRALIGVNSLPYYSNNASVFDDVFIEGATFSFPLARPTYPGEDIGIDSLGLYRAGDTVHLKWMTIDIDHYEFWSSLEFDSNNVGPFASYTRANSNIEGGLGFWGGYAAYYYDYIIPK